MCLKYPPQFLYKRSNPLREDNFCMKIDKLKINTQTTRSLLILLQVTRRNLLSMISLNSKCSTWH